MPTTKIRGVINASGTLGDAYDGWITDIMDVAAYDEIAFSYDLAPGTATALTFAFEQSDGGPSAESASAESFQDVKKATAGTLAIEEVAADSMAAGRHTIRLNTSGISKLKIKAKVNTNGTGATLTNVSGVAETEDVNSAIQAKFH